MSFQRLYIILSGAVPGGLLALPIFFAALSYIWYSIYRHSGMVPRGLYKKGFGFLLAFTLVNYTLLRFILQPSADYTRILVLPFENRGDSTHAWIGEAMAYSVETMLSALESKKEVIYRREWLADLSLFPDLDERDSLLADLKKQCGIRYCLTGSYEPSGDGYRVTALFRDLKKNTIVHQDTETAPGTALFSINRSLAKQAARYFKIRSRVRTGFVDITPSPEAYRAYIDGVIMLRGKKYDRAEKAFEKALASDSTCVRAIIGWGRSLRERALVETSEKKRAALLEDSKWKLIKALKTDKSVSDAYLELSRTHIFLERWPEAENELKISFHHQPTNARVYYLLSKLHHDRYEDYGFDTETSVLERAVAVDPAYVTAKLYLVDQYLNSNKKIKAMEKTREVIAVDPENVQAYLTLSLVYFYMNRMPDAIATCREILEKDPENSQAFYNAGIAFKGQTEYDSALVYLHRAAELNHLNAYNYIAAIYEAKKEYYKAIKYLRRRVVLGDREEQWRNQARANLYRLVHKPGIVVDTNFLYQQVEKGLSRDSVSEMNDPLLESSPGK